PEKARQYYEQALSLQPGHPAAHANLGALLRGEKRFDEAVACYRRALELQPRSAFAHYGLAQVFADMDCHEEALSALRSAIEIEPDWLDARWACVMTQLPWVYEIDAEPARYRDAFKTELGNLQAWLANRQ